jgi:hypothetical protein
MGVGGKRHASAALYPQGNDPPVTIVQEAGWASELVWTQRLEEKSFAFAGDGNPGRPVCSQTLYWLSYPNSFIFYCRVLKLIAYVALVASVKKQTR